MRDVPSFAFSLVGLQTFLLLLRLIVVKSSLTSDRQICSFPSLSFPTFPFQLAFFKQRCVFIADALLIK
jgi:hypothetical protein